MTPFPRKLAFAAMTLVACGWGTHIGGSVGTNPPPSSGGAGHDSGTGACENRGCGGADAFVAPVSDVGVDAGLLPDAAASPTEVFELVAAGSAAEPLSCPSAHWEFSGLPASVELKNTGTVALAYIAEQAAWDLGAEYAPGVPTGMSMERVGVLAPGAEVTIASRPGGYEQTALIGASKPFSIYDGGFAAADEWTIPWPQGVSGSDGSMTMYVAEIDDVSACGPVTRP
jgi:hypothetical protein